MSECKLNVILDLDNTIINAIENSEKLKVPSTAGLTYVDWIPMFRIYARPHLDEFLDYIFANFNVSVFTAADKDYALHIVEKFIYKNHPERRLKFFFYRYHVEWSHRAYGGVKNLQIIWNMFKLPGFYPCNTVIIDDLDQVYKTNPFNTLPIKAFYVVDDYGEYNPNASSDTSLLEMKEKLKYIKGRFDVTECTLYGNVVGCKDLSTGLLERHDIV